MLFLTFVVGVIVGIFSMGVITHQVEHNIKLPQQ